MTRKASKRGSTTRRGASKRGKSISVTTKRDEGSAVFPLLLPEVKEEPKETSGECLLTEEKDKENTCMSNYNTPEKDSLPSECSHVSRPHRSGSRKAPRQTDCVLPGDEKPLLKTPYEECLLLKRRKLALHYTLPQEEEHGLRDHRGEASLLTPAVNLIAEGAWSRKAPLSFGGRSSHCFLPIAASSLTSSSLPPHYEDGEQQGGSREDLSRHNNLRLHQSSSSKYALTPPETPFTFLTDSFEEVVLRRDTMFSYEDCKHHGKLSLVDQVPLTLGGRSADNTDLNRPASSPKTSSFTHHPPTSPPRSSHSLCRENKSFVSPHSNITVNNSYSRGNRRLTSEFNENLSNNPGEYFELEDSDDGSEENSDSSSSSNIPLL